VAEQSVMDLLYVAAFFLGGLGFAAGPFILAFFLAPRKTRNCIHKTSQSIECGMVPIGEAWIRFGIVYYLYALIFLAFDVDVLFLSPVAMTYNKNGGLRDFVELTIFVGILSLAVAYAWQKGVFRWERKIYKTR